MNNLTKHLNFPKDRRELTLLEKFTDIMYCFSIEYNENSTDVYLPKEEDYWGCEKDINILKEGLNKLKNIIESKNHDELLKFLDLDIQKDIYPILFETK